MKTYMQRVSAVVLACFVATACTEKLKEHLEERVAQQQTSDDTNGNPCSLLDSAEVAAAIGPLAGPPYRGDPIPDQSNETCRYDSQDYRRIRVNVDWSGGAMAMKMISFGRNLTDKALRAETKTGVVAKEGDSLHGNWDQIAMTPASCCSFEARCTIVIAPRPWHSTGRRKPANVLLSHPHSGNAESQLRVLDRGAAPWAAPGQAYFVTRAPVSFAIAASVVCAAFNPSRKSSSL